MAGKANGDSGAAGVNDAGTVVGWASNAAGDRRAFLYTDADGMVDLNDRIDPASGWTLTDAAAINAAGQIVGNGLLGGTTHAFRLTPPGSEPPPEPELLDGGVEPTLPWANDKPTVMALREIAAGNISTAYVQAAQRQIDETTAAAALEQALAEELGAELGEPEPKADSSE